MKNNIVFLICNWMSWSRRGSFSSNKARHILLFKFQSIILCPDNFMINYSSSENHGESSVEMSFSDCVRVSDCPYTVIVEIVDFISCKCSFITKKGCWKSIQIITPTIYNDNLFGKYLSRVPMPVMIKMQFLFWKMFYIAVLGSPVREPQAAICT